MIYPTQTPFRKGPGAEHFNRVAARVAEHINDELARAEIAAKLGVDVETITEVMRMK